MADDYEERARAWLRKRGRWTGLDSDLAALLRDVAEAATAGLSRELRAADMATAEYLAKADETIGLLRSTLNSVSKERDRLRADLTAAQNRYAALCVGDPYSGDAFVSPASAAVTLAMRDELRAEREKREWLEESRRVHMGTSRRLRADLAAERERYAALRAKLARRVDLHDADGRALHTERERVERLRVVAEYAKWVRTDAGDVVPGLSRALDALLPGDLEPSDE